MGRAEALHQSIHRDPADGHCTAKKIRREDVSADDCLCNHCTAKCCRYFALPIDDADGSRRTSSYIRWYPAARSGDACSSRTVRGTCWCTPSASTCADDNLCGIYETRPQICRDYTTDKCEYEDDWVYDHYLERPEQVREYAEAVLARRKAAASAAPCPSAADRGLLKIGDGKR